jgi:hypothetical protein
LMLFGSHVLSPEAAGWLSPRNGHVERSPSDRLVYADQEGRPILAKLVSLRNPSFMAEPWGWQRLQPTENPWPSAALQEI